jgi:hypothetical protein
MATSTGIWTEVETDDQIQLCSLMLQSSRPRYNGHLTHKNLKNLLAQVNSDDNVSPMFEMELYQEDDDSDYDLVLVEYLSLDRNSAGTATFNQWCLTFGVSPTTAKTVSQLYAILKAAIKQQMAEEPGIKVGYVYLDTDTFKSGSPFDQIMQLLFDDITAGNVIVSKDYAVEPYGAYANDNPDSKTLHRFEIQQIN